MNIYEQQIAAAELDGHPSAIMRKYSKSYDAIIPLICKWCGDDDYRWCCLRCVMQMPKVCSTSSLIHELFDKKPAQLLEDLLRTAGKWKE